MTQMKNPGALPGTTGARIAKSEPSKSHSSYNTTGRSIKRRYRRIPSKKIAEAALSNAERIVRAMLPNGKRQGPEWVALNPRRADRHLGSFCIRLGTGEPWPDDPAPALSPSERSKLIFKLNLRGLLPDDTEPLSDEQLRGLDARTDGSRAFETEFPKANLAPSDLRANPRFRFLVNNLHECGDRAVAEAIMAIARGKDPMTVLEDYARFAPEAFQMMGADTFSPSVLLVWRRRP